MKIFYSEKDQARVEELIRDATKAEAGAAVLREQNKVIQVQLDFMRHRVNQLELERATLLNKVSGVAIPVPEIVPLAQQLDVRELLQAMPSFEDIGDEEAGRQGITIDPATGETRYRGDNKE